MSKGHELRLRYIELFGIEPASSDSITAIERELGVLLPADVRKIAEFYRGGVLGGVSHNRWEPHGPATNVVTETNRLRHSVALPSQLIALAETDEGLIVLNCSPHSDPSVVWCSLNQVEELNANTVPSNSETWSSYMDFIEYLVTEEINERNS